MPQQYAFGRHLSDLTSARLTNSNRRSRPATWAQVAELVDALASGASGLTAAKVRVLSWAPALDQSAIPSSPPLLQSKGTRAYQKLMFGRHRPIFSHIDANTCRASRRRASAANGW